MFEAVFVGENMKDNTFIGLSISAMQNGTVKQDKEHIDFIKKKYIETCS